jgi:hypothetical protein
MRSILFLLVSAAGSAQILSVASVHAVPGEEVRVDISIESPPGKAPLTLKWDTVFPIQLLDLIGDSLEPGKAAKDSDKSITCVKPKPYAYTCIMFGAPKPLANGVIATLHFKLHPDARPGTATVKVQNGEAVAGDLKVFPLKDAVGSLDIR